jgi:hypothetical protein
VIRGARQGLEDIDKIYGESFLGTGHLRRILLQDIL